MGYVEVSTDLRLGLDSYPVISAMFQLCYTRADYTKRMSDAEDYWPGQRFGLPMEGPRSTPTYLRRVLALGIDWAIAVGVSVLFFNYNTFATLGVFIGVSMLSGLILAGTPGHLLTKIRIAPIRGGALGWLAPLVRPILVALVIPALIADDDMRGAHDRLVGTILVLR